MRRTAPRPLALALQEAVREAAPATLLARVQSAWSGAVGPALAAEAEPVSEREGVVTVRCSGAVWAHELELLGPELSERLNQRVAPASVARLRFVVGSGTNGGRQ